MEEIAQVLTAMMSCDNAERSAAVAHIEQLRDQGPSAVVAVFHPFVTDDSQQDMLRVAALVVIKNAIRQPGAVETLLASDGGREGIAALQHDLLELTVRGSCGTNAMRTAGHVAANCSVVLARGQPGHVDACASFYAERMPAWLADTASVRHGPELLSACRCLGALCDGAAGDAELMAAVVPSANAVGVVLLAGFGSVGGSAEALAEEATVIGALELAEGAFKVFAEAGSDPASVAAVIQCIFATLKAPNACDSDEVQCASFGALAALFSDGTPFVTGELLTAAVELADPAILGDTVSSPVACSVMRLFNSVAEAAKKAPPAVNLQAMLAAGMGSLMAKLTEIALLALEGSEGEGLMELEREADGEWHDLALAFVAALRELHIAANCDEALAQSCAVAANMAVGEEEGSLRPFVGGLILEAVGRLLSADSGSRVFQSSVPRLLGHKQAAVRAVGYDAACECAGWVNRELGLAVAQAAVTSVCGETEMCVVTAALAFVGAFAATTEGSSGAVAFPVDLAETLFDALLHREELHDHLDAGPEIAEGAVAASREAVMSIAEKFVDDSVVVNGSALPAVAKLAARFLPSVLADLETGGRTESSSPALEVRVTVASALVRCAARTDFMRFGPQFLRALSANVPLIPGKAALAICDTVARDPPFETRSVADLVSTLAHVLTNGVSEINGGLKEHEVPDALQAMAHLLERAGDSVDGGALSMAVDGYDGVVERWAKDWTSAAGGRKPERVAFEGLRQTLRGLTCCTAAVADGRGSDAIATSLLGVIHRMHAALSGPIQSAANASPTSTEEAQALAHAIAQLMAALTVALDGLSDGCRAMGAQLLADFAR